MVEAILKMSSPSSLKEVQTLNGRLVAINRFLARYAQRSLPFISTLKLCTNKKDFSWTPEAEKAFSYPKTFLAKLPTLTAPIPKERLKMYLSALNQAINTVLMVEQNEKQTPI
jgi:hypothetical protein